ncbi:hypothetical protein GCM10010911_62620 [Paenibacillus nasutitermitis]|uniref:Uncharacterized protein n=1 Tax=Paenibacillus nasutitermitis TaxID=1652958 RepID=A0A917E304_9BACL|nr:hypothetical protein GCM10010911_62620 [Paenibacillus nasutitermitis]
MVARDDELSQADIVIDDLIELKTIVSQLENSCSTIGCDSGMKQNAVVVCFFSFEVTGSRAWCCLVELLGSYCSIIWYNYP